ncbi:MAG: hypothetical protein NUV51_04345 [Sulfuricaulis sp.]|nr:hypothetical protein [Sulfuricaulis sp.]
MLDWIEQQFRELGKGKESPDLALYLVSALQRASLLTHAFKKPDLIVREAGLLKEWVYVL